MLKQHPTARTQSNPARLISYSRAVPEISLLDFLRMAPPDAQRVYWAHQDHPIQFAGYGVAAEVYADGPARFETVQREAATLFEGAIVEGHEPGIAPRLFGGFAFRDDHQPDGIWDAFPAAYFLLPRYLLTRIGGRAWLTVNTCVMPGDEADVSRELAWMIQRLSHTTPRLHSEYARTWMQSPTLTYPLERPFWRQQVDQVTNRIRSGELKKAVLARTSDLTYDDPVDPLYAMERLATRYAQAYRFLVEPRAGSAFFGATPELLIATQGAKFHTAALAGSIKRGSSPDEDAAFAQQLLDTPKERHEHALVVDALREMLTPFSDTLHANDTPGIYTLSNIQHLYTPFSGTLRPGAYILDLVAALHPTPALGGTPRGTALKVIASAEPATRGWYAAPVGWFDAEGSGTFAVAIRSAVSRGRTARLYAGAGIVADSDPDREWDETQLKFRPMLEALGLPQ